MKFYLAALVFSIGHCYFAQSLEKMEAFYIDTNSLNGHTIKTDLMELTYSEGQFFELMTNMRSKEYPNYAVIVSADEDDRIFSSYTAIEMFLQKRATEENAAILLVRSNPKLMVEYIVDLVRELIYSMIGQMEIRITQMNATPFAQITYDEEMVFYPEFEDLLIDNIEHLRVILNKWSITYPENYEKLLKQIVDNRKYLPELSPGEERPDVIVYDGTDHPVFKERPTYIAAVLNHLLEIKKTFVMVTNMQPGNLSKFVRTLEAAGLKVVIQLLASERVVPLNY